MKGQTLQGNQLNGSQERLVRGPDLASRAALWYQARMVPGSKQGAPIPVSGSGGAIAMEVSHLHSGSVCMCC